MKILILLPHPIESPGPRFRIYQYLPYFKEAGIEYTVSPFLNSDEYIALYNNYSASLYKKSKALIRGSLRQLSKMLYVKSYDAVIVYREAMLWGKPWIEKYITKLGIPIIHDFDDAIWLPVKSQINMPMFIKRFLKSEKKFDEIMKLSNRIVVCNNYLAQHANLLNKNTTIIPIVINTDHFKPVEKNKNTDKIVIGWVGSGSTVKYLKLLDNIWRKLPPNCELRIVGGQYFPDGIKVTNIKWTLAAELSEFSMLDIGITPMLDDDWAKGKGGGKTLQYMAMSIPTIGSAVGINTEIIQDGVNGFLAKDEKEWIEKLTLLIENPELRQRLGRAGRKTVEERYSLKVWAPRYVEIIKKVVELRS